MLLVICTRDRQLVQLRVGREEEVQPLLPRLTLPEPSTRRERATKPQKMAKQGEGDGRWIVKEREDGTNCNGWHWSEKNLTEWAKERLTELLGDIVVLDDSTGTCQISAVEKIMGDVTVQARKQKKFPLYELEITLKWEGQLFDAEVRPAPPCRVPAPPVTAAVAASATMRPRGVRRASPRSVPRARSRFPT